MNESVGAVFKTWIPLDVLAWIFADVFMGQLSKSFPRNWVSTSRYTVVDSHHFGPEISTLSRFATSRIPNYNLHENQCGIVCGHSLKLEILGSAHLLARPDDVKQIDETLAT